MNFFINSIVSILISCYILIELISFLKKVPIKSIKIYLIVFTVLHFMGCFVFLSIIDKQDNSIDAVRFFNNALETDKWTNLVGLGSSFVSFLIYPVVKLGVRLEVLFFLFSTISFKGFLIYFNSIGVDKLQLKNKWLLLLFLTPSLHFWTGFLGKEALLLLLMVLLLEKIKLKTFDWKFILIFIFIFLIRPHVFFVLMIALGVLFLVDDYFTARQKRNLILFSLICFSIMIPITLVYFLGIETLNLTSMNEYWLSFLEYTDNRGDASISLRNTTIFTRIFYLVLMPLPFLYAIQTKLQLIVSIENIYYLSIFVLAVVYFFRYGLKFKQLNIELKYTLIASGLLIILFGSYLYNLGLGNRMRIMFFPYIFYFLIQTIPQKFRNE